MKTITLFEKYQEALRHRSYALWERGYESGIAVHNDHCALEWQRYDRLARKLEQRLIAILEQEKE